ncbi:MAG: InlB B-repeat-containing protein [Clostridia bacterium]|nr:InlB B-repeat-containing protein [Clostridia bacterium]
MASGTATVVREGNTFFVTPTSNVVITINFEALPTYTVTFVENGTEVGNDSTYSGGFIKLPEYSGELDEYTTFDGWAEQENETDSAKIYAAKATYAVTKNVTLYAQFTVTEPPVVEGDHYFIKVTEDQTDWTGTYLIVYEAGSIAFNGAMANKLDAVSNGVGVTMADGKIAATDANIAVSFVVEKIEGGYTIRSKSGLYFGSESDTNSLLSNATKTYFNNFAIDADGNTTVTGEGGAILRYNATSGQDRFRFYKTSSYTSQQPIALYKLDVADITGAQVTMGSDLTMKYYVDVTNIENVDDGDLTMRFSIDGEVIDTVTGTVVGGQYVFDFAGLAPQRMADEIKAEVLYKGTLIDVKDNYSIKTNAQNLLTENAGNAELCQFITDMLYYGAAAQKYTKYNTDNLATEGVTGLGEPFDAELTDYYNKFNLSTTIGDAGFRSATVWFDVTNRLIVKVSKKTEDTAVKVYVTPDGGTRTELSYNDTVGGYMTDEIKVTEFHNAFVFELCDGEGNVMQTLTYSVNSYAYSKQNSTNANMAELALALFRLGQSAENL